MRAPTGTFPFGESPRPVVQLDHNVAVRFAKSAAPWILERQWHPKQKVKHHRDGSITLSFPAPALYEVKRWVLSWGAEAEVVGPKELG